MRERADSAFTVCPFHHFLWKRGGDGASEGVNHEGARRKRRQELEPQFLETGAAYVMRTEAFLASDERFCGRTVMYSTPPERCLEIDEPEDFVRAEAALRASRRGAVVAALPRAPAALILDFDGVLTDNRVWVDQDGREAVMANRGDGMGLGLLARAGVKLLILSKEQNPVVGARARKLKIECLQGIDDKVRVLQRWLADHGVKASDAVYIGNDVNDLECMALVGCAAAPADAHPTALSAAQIVLGHRGGHGAVRELCDAVLARLGATG
jgi:N-acylneuraminate cytidylyltransferase